MAPRHTTPRSRPISRLVRRVLLALLAGFGLLALERFGLLDKLTGTGILPSRIDWSSDYAVVEHLRTQVIADGLTKGPKDCLLFIVNGNDPPNAQAMQVVEKHSGTCPTTIQGTKGALPILFTLLVDRIAHSVRTDAGTPGQFHPLP